MCDNLGASRQKAFQGEVNPAHDHANHILKLRIRQLGLQCMLEGGPGRRKEGLSGPGKPPSDGGTMHSVNLPNLGDVQMLNCI